MAFAIRKWNDKNQSFILSRLASLHGSGSLGIGLPPFPLTALFSYPLYLFIGSD